MLKTQISTVPEMQCKGPALPQAGGRPVSPLGVLSRSSWPLSPPRLDAYPSGHRSLFTDVPTGPWHFRLRPRRNASRGRRGRLLPPLLSIKGLEQRRAHRGRSASVCPRKGPCYHGALARTARLGGEEREPDSTFGRQLTSSQPHAAKVAREGARDPGRGAERTWSEACAGPTSRGAGGASAPSPCAARRGLLCALSLPHLEGGSRLHRGEVLTSAPPAAPPRAPGSSRSITTQYSLGSGPRGSLAQI